MLRLGLAFPVLVVLLASAAVADPDAPTVPFRRMKNGEKAECAEANGCVVMTTGAYHQLMQAAIAKGAELACRKGVSL
jgi:hypothetical protein